MPLHVHVYGGGAHDLVVLHGLFGAGSNWRAASRHLSDEHRVLAADLRNHGLSPHSARMDYPAMVADVVRLIDERCGGQADLLGHSMGGKVAMGTVLTAPERVRRMVVVDVAPVSYGHRDVFCRYIEAMAALPLADLGSREEADERLRGAVPEARVRAFLLHSLRRVPEGGWCWRVNLAALAANIEHITGFPYEANAPWGGAALFVGGAESSYITAAHGERIAALFPNSTLRRVAGAGHWVHADRPEALEALVQPFLRP